jgi:diphosphomevalonate decarboxylase
VNSNGGYAFAPANIALCKYWGKRDSELNLPVTSSLSISLRSEGVFTRISHLQEAERDKYVVNGLDIDLDTTFAKRLNNFLDLFRPDTAINYKIETNSTIPIAAGFASSAAGFAALVLALNNLYDWQLEKEELSILARLGSGSACRSLWDGFVEWERGEDLDGMDCFAHQLNADWPDLRIASVIVSSEKKTISSRDAMALSVRTSPLYSNWSDQVANDLDVLKRAIYAKDFVLFGETAERNSETMHAIMAKANSPIIYSTEKTQEIKRKIKSLRNEGIPVYFTQDAGANLHLLFLEGSEKKIKDNFNDIEIIKPFVDTSCEEVVLVDERDIEVGILEKMAAHKQAKLHRAFSVFILRRNGKKIEVLLQQRQRDKYHSSNLWSNTCCGHPRKGEDTLDAAKRRLQEEMGIDIANLNSIGKFHYEAFFSGVNLTENEIDHVFVGFFEDDKLSVNPKEVQDYRWFEISQLEHDVVKNQESYTAWFKQALELLEIYLNK